MGGIFGGSKSKQKSKSSNQAYGYIKDTFSPLTQYAGTGAESLSALLGGDSTGFDAYKRATGFDAMAEQGSRGITGNAAAGGLLRSGSTAKGLQEYGNNIQNQYVQQYMQQLLGLSGLGMGAGQLISGAGGVNKSSGSSNNKSGIGGLVGGVASGIAASDRRLKKDITKVGALPNGLNVYEFTYINDSGPHVGVMADEVAKLMPEALGPVVDGYMTVNYNKIEQGVL